MTSSSADAVPATVARAVPAIAARRSADDPPHHADAVDARGRLLRLVAAALVAAGALLGASATSPGSTSAVFTDTETVVTTVRTVPDFGAPRTAPDVTAPRPVGALTSTPPATPPATATPTPTAPEPRDDPRAPREGRGR